MATSFKQEVKDNRTRARGILVALLAFIVTFSLLWYFMVPRSGFGVVEADKTEAVAIETLDPFYVLLVGSDSLKGTAMFTGLANSAQMVERADVITLVRIDPIERVITLLSIPRDTYCADSEEKLGDIFLEDTPELLLAEVKELAGVEVDYYFVTTFAAFENLIDEIGGIQVDVAQEVSVLDPTTGKEIGVRAGARQTLYGAQALAFASFIDEADPNGDALRQNNVRTVEQAMLQRVTTGGEDSARRAITALRDNCTTNIEHTLLISLAVDYALHEQDYRFLSGTAPYVLEQQVSGAWAVPFDAAQWRALMSLVDTGQDPTYVVALPENADSMEEPLINFEKKTVSSSAFSSPMRETDGQDVKESTSASTSASASASASTLPSTAKGKKLVAEDTASVSSRNTSAREHTQAQGHASSPEDK